MTTRRLIAQHKNNDLASVVLIVFAPCSQLSAGFLPERGLFDFLDIPDHLNIQTLIDNQSKPATEPASVSKLLFGLTAAPLWKRRVR
jgi:hypothetical protein